MTFDEVLEQAIEMLQRRGRVSYGALKRQFDLDDAYLVDLKDELIDVLEVAADKDGKMLVWVGQGRLASSVQSLESENSKVQPQEAQTLAPRLTDPRHRPPITYTPAHLAERIRAVSVTDGERKTITALFADLKGSTALIEGLDPEEARTVIDPALQLMMDAVHQYDGFVAQALGDGVFALFGAPLAHEDHPQRALYAALRMQETMRSYGATLPEHYSDLAHHYHHSPNSEKAIVYLQLAGQQAVQRSANTEAIDHLTAALDLLLTRPETPERTAQELALHLAVGPVLMSTLGFAASAVERHYTRARALCDQLGDSPQRFPALWGLWAFHAFRGDLRTTQALAEECLQLAEQTHETGLLVEALFARGATLLWRGELIRARKVLEHSLTLYQPQHQMLTPLYGGFDLKVLLLGHMPWMLWPLGYPKQALTWNEEALQLARELGHSYSLVSTLWFGSWVHLERGAGGVAQECAEVGMALCIEHGFSPFLTMCILQRGAALIRQEQWKEGVAQMQTGLETAVGEFHKPRFLAWLAVGYGGAGQVEEGLAAITEALLLVEKNDDRFYEAEVWRIKGTLTLEAGG